MTVATLLSVNNLSIRYRIGRGMPFGRPRHFDAVSDVSFDIGHGETLSLVGESGAGKSTVGRAILGLVRYHSGEIIYEGQRMSAWGSTIPLHFRRAVQAVFQDPASALNRRMLVRDLIGEVIRIHAPTMDPSCVRQRCVELLEMVGLSPFHQDRYPDELSGGQKQRVSIARALAPKPSLIVCDEATSALDLSTQNQIINLLRDLRAELGLSLLFISHNLSIVEHISDRVAVMKLGKVIEIGRADQICNNPTAPYTQALWQAIPTVRRLRSAPVIDGQLINRASEASD